MSEPIKINSKILKTAKVDWKLIKTFQPKGFKAGDKSGIKESIINNELLDNYIVFTTKGSKEIYMFDGHSRQEVMIEMEESGKYIFDKLLDCDFLEFKTKSEAGIALLQYQAGKLKIAKSGLQEFATQINLPEETAFQICDDYNIEIAKEPKGAEEKGFWKETKWKLEVVVATEKEARDLNNELLLKGYENVKIKALQS